MAEEPQTALPAPIRSEQRFSPEAEVFAEIVGDENRQGHLQDDEDEAFQSG